MIVLGGLNPADWDLDVKSLICIPVAHLFLVFHHYWRLVINCVELAILINLILLSMNHN